MADTLRILHLTDTHAFGDDTLHYERVDTAQQLTRLLYHIDASREFDLIVCSGDVSEDGSEESYLRVAEILEPFARSRGARVIYAMGNHDQRAAFRAVLGEGQDGTEFSSLEGDSTDRPIVSAVTVHGWRTIVLDSSVPFHGHGELGSDQLEFLAEQLRVPAELGTVVIVHHPPVEAQTDLLQALALQDPKSLLKTITGSDVVVVLSGHYHLPITEHIGGITLTVAPGVANIARSVDNPLHESATHDTGASIVEVSGRWVRVAPFVIPFHQEDAFRMDPEIVSAIISKVGPGAAASK